jgi:hypothetical protein
LDPIWTQTFQEPRGGHLDIHIASCNGFVNVADSCTAEYGTAGVVPDLG